MWGIRGKSKKIFTHGYSTKTNHKGFGLRNSANYLAEMGGTILAESGGQGKGAVFTISLPLKREKTFNNALVLTSSHLYVPTLPFDV